MLTQLDETLQQRFAEQFVSQTVNVLFEEPDDRHTGISSATLSAMCVPVHPHIKTR